MLVAYMEEAVSPPPNNNSSLSSPQSEMRASSNPETREMMAQYDRNVAAGLLPCSPEEGIPCDVKIANGIGYGTVRH